MPAWLMAEGMQFFISLENAGDDQFVLTWLELVVLFGMAGLPFPVSGDGRCRWVAASLAPLQGSPTLAVQLCLFRQASKGALLFFGLEALVMRNPSLVSLGFRMPFEGVVLRCDSGLLHTARQRLRDFAGGRHISTAAQLARPLV